MQTIEKPINPPVFMAEAEAAGLGGEAFSVSAGGVIIMDAMPADKRAALVALVEAHDATQAAPVDMVALRQAAFTAAMAFGNAITAKVIGSYTDVAARTWPLQRWQADTVLSGEELPPDALLRKLALRRGMDLEPFALLVQHKAETFETIVDAGEGLRLGAEGLLSEALNNPAALAAAVESLRLQTLAAAAELGLTV